MHMNDILMTYYCQYPSCQSNWGGSTNPFKRFAGPIAEAEFGPVEETKETKETKVEGVEGVEAAGWMFGIS